jgi:hypothetical protein
MNSSVEKVQQRLERTVKILTDANIPYAVIGGNAVRAWVAQADESAVRNTRDVDIILNREDRDRAIEVMGQAGFIFRVVKGIPMFLDGPDAKARDAVHLLYSNVRLRPSDIVETPSVSDYQYFGDTRVITLNSLLVMKLNANRDKDRMHVRDLIDVGLIDKSWIDKLPTELGTRLQEIIDTPEDEPINLDN